MPSLTYENILFLKCQSTGYIECYIASWIWKIVPLSLVSVGVIGNVLSLIVLSSRQLSKKSTCVYLKFLAVTDTSVLCSGPLLHSLRYIVGYDAWTTSPLSCSIIGWIGFSSGIISCWIIVLVTAERTFVTLFPVKVKPMMTPRNALIMSVTLSILVVLLNGHMVYGNIIVERQVNITETTGASKHTIRSCSMRQGEYSYFYKVVWSKLLFITGSVVPIILIVAGNAIVAISLIKSRRALQRVQNSDGRGVAVGISHLSSRNRANYKLFFVLCSVYIMTTVPYGIYLGTFPFDKEVDDHNLAKYQLVAVIMRCLLWSNFSFNFILYILTGSVFRKELRRIIESAYTSFHSFKARGTSVVKPSNEQNTQL